MVNFSDFREFEKIDARKQKSFKIPEIEKYFKLIETRSNSLKILYFLMTCTTDLRVTLDHLFALDTNIIGG